MRLPMLNRITTTRSMVDVFGGYNHNLRIGDGEFYDMTNLTSDDYPVLSPRRQRGIFTFSPDTGDPIENATGLLAKDSLCYVARPTPSAAYRVHINGHAIQDTETCSMALGDALPKTLVSMGAYIIIMPDRKYVNTEDYSDCGDIEASISTASNVRFELCKIDGAGFGDMTVGDTPPPLSEGQEEWADRTLWLDTSGDTHVLKQYSTTNSQWVAVATTYIKITFEGGSFSLTKLFSDGDGITISGIKKTISETGEMSFASNAKVKAQLEALENTMVAWKVGDDYIVVTGILDRAVTLNPSINNPHTSVGPVIRLARQMPKMDFVIESGNRLWGCRYGVANNGQVVNEIYASKLGDFKNWNVFAGISTDSYAASVGSDGQFTGAITHLGYPIFFKENCFHKVYGNYPANYKIQTTACRGVQKGCSESLAIVNETLFYKSMSAVCAYDGSLPVEMSAALGTEAYSNAAAGVLGNKYYISMQDASGKYHLFVYDTAKGMWHREDDTQAVEFCFCRGDLYYIDYADKLIKTVKGTGTLDTSPVRWSAVTGIIGTDSPDKKYISRMDVRLSLNIGSRVTIYAEYDSSGVWEHVLTIDGNSLRTFPVSVRPKRCDHMRLKLEGYGEVKIFSICKTTAQGSDV